MTVERTFGVLKGRGKILADRMPLNEIGATMSDNRYVLYSLQFCCTLYNLILLHETGTPITPRDPHVSDPPNVQLYNDGNQLTMDELRDEIPKMISSRLR